MNRLTLLLLMMLVTGCHTSAPEEERVERLIQRLRTIEPEGPTTNGRWVGVQLNEVTTELIRMGSPVVPRLVRELDASNLHQTVHIVVVLRELKAWDATERVARLKEEVAGGRFADVERDRTLEAMIDQFLARVGP